MVHTPPRKSSSSTHLPTPPPTVQKFRQPLRQIRSPSTPIHNSSATQDDLETDPYIPEILRYGVPGYAIPAMAPEPVDPAVFERCALHPPVRWSQPLSDSTASSNTVLDDSGATAADNSQEENNDRPVIGGYFKFLQRAIEGIDPHDAAVLRRKAPGLASMGDRQDNKPEPLFLPVDNVQMASMEGEGDDIEFTGRGVTGALVRHIPPGIQSSGEFSNTALRIRKRSRSVQDNDEDDFEITGQVISPKRPRTERGTTTTPLREGSADFDFELPCDQCGCACRSPGGARGTGSGSQVLSLSVRANLLRLLLGEGLSFHQQLRRMGAVFANWADVAVHVGATRRDFDRVRHAADWMQRELPMWMRRGQL